MIEKDSTFGIFTVSCDGCGFDREFDVNDNWDALMREMKAEGWVSKKVNGEWEHYCPDCVEEL
jgi:Fe2+ or Zn2+ uptake regulation protein